MISQKCPRCASSRIRRGYRPTPFWSKMIFRYYLLCDHCNWEFAGFAVPGTVSSKPTKKRKISQTADNDIFASKDKSDASGADEKQVDLPQTITPKRKLGKSASK